MKLLCILLPLSIVACNNQPKATSGTNSAANAEARMAAVLKIAPGNWATQFRIVAMDKVGSKDPKTSEAIQQALAAHGAQASEFENCVSAAQAAEPLAILFAGSDVANCRYDSLNAAGGRLTAKMTCRQGSGTVIRTMTGTYTSTTYAFTTESVGDGSTAATDLTMKTQIRASRVGACAVDIKNTV